MSVTNRCFRPLTLFFKNLSATSTLHSLENNQKDSAVICLYHLKAITSMLLLSHKIWINTCNIARFYTNRHTNRECSILKPYLRKMYVVFCPFPAFRGQWSCTAQVFSSSGVLGHSAWDCSSNTAPLYRWVHYHSKTKRTLKYSHSNMDSADNPSKFST